MKALADGIRKCEEGSGPAEELLDEVEAAIFKIRNMAANSSLAFLQDSVRGARDTIMQLKELNGTLSGIPTGSNRLDFLTGGFQRSDLIILGGRPGMGKTAITLNLALNAAIPSIRQGQRGMPAFKVLFLSLEMGMEQIVMRVLCQMGGFGLLKMRAGRLSDEEHVRVSDTMVRMEAARVCIDDSSGLRPLDLRAKARRLQRKIRATS